MQNVGSFDFRSPLVEASPRGHRLPGHFRADVQRPADSLGAGLAGSRERQVQGWRWDAGSMQGAVHGGRGSQRLPGQWVGVHSHVRYSRLWKEPVSRSGCLILVAEDAGEAAVAPTPTGTSY